MPYLYWYYTGLVWYGLSKSCLAGTKPFSGNNSPLLLASLQCSGKNFSLGSPFYDPIVGQFSKTNWPRFARKNAFESKRDSPRVRVHADSSSSLVRFCDSPILQWRMMDDRKRELLVGREVFVVRLLKGNFLGRRFG